MSYQRGIPVTFIRDWISAVLLDLDVFRVLTRMMRSASATRTSKEWHYVSPPRAWSPSAKINNMFSLWFSHLSATFTRYAECLMDL